MDSRKLDYAPADPERPPILLYFWGMFFLGASIGLPLVGVRAWTALCGSDPDQSGMVLLLLGVGATAFVARIVQLAAWRLICSPSGGAAMVAGIIAGLLSPLLGIAMAIVFFS